MKIPVRLHLIVKSWKSNTNVISICQIHWEFVSNLSLWRWNIDSIDENCISISIYVVFEIANIYKWKWIWKWCSHVKVTVFALHFSLCELWCNNFWIVTEARKTIKLFSLRYAKRNKWTNIWTCSFKMGRCVERFSSHKKDRKDQFNRNVTTQFLVLTRFVCENLLNACTLK